jgi:hypothetical protein
MDSGGSFFAAQQDINNSLQALDKAIRKAFK